MVSPTSACGSILCRHRQCCVSRSTSTLAVLVRSRLGSNSTGYRRCARELERADAPTSLVCTTVDCASMTPCRSINVETIQGWTVATRTGSLRALNVTVWLCRSYDENEEPTHGSEHRIAGGVAAGSGS